MFWQYKSTWNIWLVISRKHQVKQVGFFNFFHFHLSSIIWPLENCHPICKPNNLRTHRCSVKNWSNVNTNGERFAGIRENFITGRIEKPAGWFSLTFSNNHAGWKEERSNTFSSNTRDTVSFILSCDRYGDHGRGDIMFVTLSAPTTPWFFGGVPGRELNLNRGNRPWILALNASRPTVSRNLP